MNLGTYKAGDAIRYRAQFHDDTGAVADPSTPFARLERADGSFVDFTAPSKVDAKTGLFGGSIDSTGFATGSYWIRIGGTVATAKAVATVYTFQIVAATAADAKTSADQAKTSADQAARAGDAMTLTPAERVSVADVVEAQIIDDTDSEKVLQAIVDKIASANPSLDDLTLGGIASAVRTEIERVGGMLEATRDGVTAISVPSAATVAQAVNDALADDFAGIAAAVNAVLLDDFAGIVADVDVQAIVDAIAAALAAAHGAGSWAGAGGSGAWPWTPTVKIGGVGVPDVEVTVHRLDTDALVAGTLYTNANGECRDATGAPAFRLDAGEYRVRLSKTGANAATYPFRINADGTETRL